jgi:hypothetical protein
MLLNFVTEHLVRDYLLFVYLLCLSALQVGATLSGLRGLTILPTPWGIPAGLICGLGALTWFFWSDDRNTIGLAGWEQFVLFTLGAAAALWTSLTLSSLLWSERRRPLPPADGVDALRHMTYWEAVASRWMR